MNRSSTIPLLGMLSLQQEEQVLAMLMRALFRGKTGICLQSYSENRLGNGSHSKVAII